MEIRVFKLEKKFIIASADYILKIIKSNSRKKLRINIALSGGSTPQPIYKALAKKLLSLKTPPVIHFYQVDERYVPATHPYSNQKMITEAFKHYKSPPISSFHFHFFNISLSIPKSLEKYSKELPKKFDLTILGIGTDGHIASLFPDSKIPKNKTVAHTTTDKFAVKNRLTITIETILKSKTIIVLLKNKQKVLLQLQNPTKSTKKFTALKLIKHRNLHIYSN